jgi:hypothetical protein
MKNSTSAIYDDYTSVVPGLRAKKAAKAMNGATPLQEKKKIQRLRLKDPHLQDRGNGDPVPDADEIAASVLPDRIKVDVNDALRKRYGGPMVTICSKLQTGIHLDLFQTVTTMEVSPTTMAGGHYGERRATTVSQRIAGERFTVPGVAQGRGTDFMPKELFGGFILCECPKKFWDLWYEQTGQHMDCCKAELLFAHDKSRDAKVHSKDNKDELTMMEPIRPPERDTSGKILGTPDPRIVREHILNKRTVQLGSETELSEQRMSGVSTV